MAQPNCPPIVDTCADILSLQESFDPEDFRAMIYSHAASERVRWFRAIPDPGYSPTSGTPPVAQGRTKWLRTEQDVSGYRALIQGAGHKREFYDIGKVRSGILTVTTMPDELPLGDHDWVIPLGRQAPVGGIYPSARTYTDKQSYVRGGEIIAQAGTVSSSGTAVVGIGTTFLSTFRVGAIIKAANVPLRVATLTDDTHLTVESAPSPVWSGNRYSLCTEQVDRFPAASIVQITDASRTYVSGTDYTLAADEQTIEWLSATNSPAPGAVFAIIYTYYAKYEVMDDLGQHTGVVQGTALPQTVSMKLVDVATG